MSTIMATGDKKENDVDMHAMPQSHLTHIQLTLLIAYVICICVWLWHWATSFLELDILHRRRGAIPEHVNSCHVDCTFDDDSSKHSSEKSSLSSDQQQQPTKESTHLQTNCPANNINHKHDQSVTHEVTETSHKTQASPGSADKLARLQVTSTVSVNRFMSSVVMFGLIMIYFFLCDYVKVFPQGERSYSRDTFLFLVFIFFLVGCALTIKSNPDKILNRDQTEEWKGWMQVMFVWYHYFAAKEWYNWIRVYIACYVWMTGFGNFSFFWVRNDYSVWRILKMMFRLNFLVTFVAMATNNEYMLYYICAMHTYWFLATYVFMRTLSSWNRNSKLMAVKFLAYAVINVVIFEIPYVSYTVFRPFVFILGYHDRSPDVLHEWVFRAGLDHWASFFGMLCAYNYPHFEALMHYIDAKSTDKTGKVIARTLRVSLFTGCVLLGTVWYSGFMWKDKVSYNKTHPYTSLVAIAIFIVARNIHPILRTHHVDMFARLGKITLETYLSQLHIYLLSNARTLLVLIPGYPFLNFSLATIVYLFVSHRLFIITNDFSSFLIPTDNRQLLTNMFYIVVLFSLSALIAFVLIAVYN